ncbi:hypothetical protein SAMN05444166_6281 [Singulisphaera sp. GP187]|uniref:hypothetical protein n=1 Tax=Singulisphaera sp. GP187 TaxID=1882752 RepID=UPI00092C423E|nr:hypothetical protein [Singulisphaera sp. GP187]SIO60139.1 hypothetical protein SAMN05444166_6281 [Singulisphaera sp. GP187]
MASLKISGIKEAKEALQRLKRDVAPEVLLPAIRRGGEVLRKQASSLTQSPRVQAGIHQDEGTQLGATVATAIEAEVGGPYAAKLLEQAVDLAQDRAIQVVTREVARRIDREVRL